MQPFIINVQPIKERSDRVLPAHGRPPSKDPKTHDTKIRMSDTDIEMLKYCCEQTGKKKAEIIRIGIKKVYEEIKNKDN